MYRRSELEVRVLILAPIGRDALLVSATLAQSGISSAVVPDAETLLSMLADGVGATIVADEALSARYLARISDWLREQPPWSDPPFIVLTPHGRPSDHTLQRAQEFTALANFTLIERPLRPETIVSSTRAALRARMKQYEIRSRQEALVRANADLEQFAHSASHDLKEPLRNISIASELLLREHGHTLGNRGNAFLELIRDNSKRMGMLLADLLAYAEASSISDESNELASASSGLTTALANLAISIREADARITVGDLPRIKMRESHITQLFQNLIGNAIKYRKDRVAPEVRVSAEHRDDRIVFSIADNGIGIRSEYRESIFGIFKRLHTNAKYSGTGMGLAICQRIVERYRGRIWVESEFGNGSTFFFSIPAGPLD